MKTYFIVLIFFSGFLFSLFPQWTQQVSGNSNNLTAIDFCNPSTGFCVGDAYTIMKTTNGGENWIMLTSPVLISFTHVKVFSPSNIIIVSLVSNTVVRTTNGGTTWDYTVINIPETEIRKQAQFVSFTNGFFLTDYHLYRTTDAGCNWTVLATTGINRDISFANENTGWICNEYTIPYPPPYGTTYSEIQRTNDAGQSWVLQVHIQEQSFGVYRVFSVDANNGFYNGFFTSSLSRTVNGGSSWGAGAYGAGLFKNYYHSTFPNVNYGWFTGEQLIKSTNAGLNWTTMTTQFGNQFNNVYFINNETGWLVKAQGMILKTTTGGEPVGIKIISSEIPRDFSLSQNYPNPFNPTTKIKFDIPAPPQPLPKGEGRFNNTAVSLKIYDILGREVTTLVNEQLKPGSYEVEWDGSKYASGIHFYSLQTEQFTQTKKMELMK